MLILQKLGCEMFEWAETRVAMRETVPQRFVGYLLSAAFLWALTLSVSPQLHERIHADASRIDHTCAVTFVSSGACDHSAPPTSISSPLALIPSANISDRLGRCIKSPFLLASIFEHAPPLNS